MKLKKPQVPLDLFEVKTDPVTHAAPAGLKVARLFDGWKVTVEIPYGTFVIPANTGEHVDHLVEALARVYEAGRDSIPVDQKEAFDFGFESGTRTADAVHAPEEDLAHVG